MEAPWAGGEHVDLPKRVRRYRTCTTTTTTTPGVVLLLFRFPRRVVAYARAQSTSKASSVPRAVYVLLVLYLYTAGTLSMTGRRQKKRRKRVAPVFLPKVKDPNPIPYYGVHAQQMYATQSCWQNRYHGICIGKGNNCDSFMAKHPYP